MLKKERIDELAAGKNVRAIAVKNFLGTLGTLTEDDAMANLNQDARLYGWNLATISAIRKGIREAGLKA